MNAAVMGSGNDSKRKPINPNAPIGPDKQGAKPIFPTAPLRDLAMLSTSVLVARFQEFVKGAGRKALVADVNSYRIRGYGATWFINATWRPGDAPIDTKRERMEFLSFGSPTLRLLLRTIISEVLPTLDSPKQRMRKLLVTEATVLSAWFYEIVLKYGLINAKVMHSDLTQKERTTLSNEFLDINSDLQVLVIMYDVSAQGLNLHSACHVAFVATAARNCALEVQGWGRILRVSEAEGLQTQVANETLATARTPSEDNTQDS